LGDIINWVSLNEVSGYSFSISGETGNLGRARGFSILKTRYFLMELRSISQSRRDGASLAETEMDIYGFNAGLCSDMFQAPAVRQNRNGRCVLQ
jgi:hypothetical protein